MKPQIYFSFGMTKSGSTLAFELARAALVLSGQHQPMLSEAAVLKRKKINFCEHIDADRAQALRNEATKIGNMIAIKTHTRPDPEVVEMLNSGAAIAHATYRDPRDMALSMVDHGAKSRAQGRLEFTEFETARDTIDELRHQSNSLLAWLSLPGVKPLFFDDLAFDTYRAATHIIDDLDVDVRVPDVIDMAVNQRGTQKNIGIKDRYRSEMTPELSAEFETVFAPLYSKLIEGRPDLRNGSGPVLNAQDTLCDWNYNLQQK